MPSTPPPKKEKQPTQPKQPTYKDGYVFVDVSYLVFYRFFALRKWFSFAHKDIKIEKDANWLSNELFMEKFAKTLLDTVLKITKKQKINPVNILFAFDCHHKDIWRHKIKIEGMKETESNAYKGTRALSHEKQNFTEFEIFDIVKKTLIPAFVKIHNNKMLDHKKAEADDCIALGIRYLRNEKKLDAPIWIVASDTDYLQICDAKTHLIDLKQNNIDQKHLIDPKITNVDYLLHKLLVGDVADNIPACHLEVDKLEELNTTYDVKIRKNKKHIYKITKSIASKLLDNKTIKKHLLNFMKDKSDTDSNKEKLFFLNIKQFTFNQNMIDFSYIPKTIETHIYGMME